MIFFSSFFQLDSFHVNTLKSLTSCPKSGICLAANASSGGVRRGDKGGGRALTITDRDDVVDDFHGRAAVDFFVEDVHSIRVSGRAMMSRALMLEIER